MPDSDYYAGLSLADALKKLAHHHYEVDNRHISRAEYDLLLRAAARIDWKAQDDEKEK